MDIKETTVIDKTTGEVLDSTAEIIKYKKVTEDSFISVYLNDMSGLMNIKNQTELRILAWM
ncbi:MAG: hypothetical protein MSA89_04230 [Clostridium sp.]|nr:hypothetical protein [Clostridium sp.]